MFLKPIFCAKYSGRCWGYTYRPHAIPAVKGLACQQADSKISQASLTSFTTSEQQQVGMGQGRRLKGVNQKSGVSGVSCAKQRSLQWGAEGSAMQLSMAEKSCQETMLLPTLRQDKQNIKSLLPANQGFVF